VHWQEEERASEKQSLVILRYIFPTKVFAFALERNGKE
jgi:hypothetical protein